MPPSPLRLLDQLVIQRQIRRHVYILTHRDV
jgi:hypothetical protein